MTTIRLLSTLAAAAALTGTIGFAYAQSTNDGSKTTATPTTTDTTPMQAPMQTSTPSSGTMPSTMRAPTDSSITTTEPAPKTDRG